jgi:hypothetical protein
MTTVQLKRNHFEFAAFAKAAIASCLVAFILAASVLSGFTSFHSHLHDARAQPHHFCFVCLLAAGQANVAEIAPFVAIISLTCLWLLRPQLLALLSVCDLRLAPGRAPPRF